MNRPLDEQFRDHERRDQRRQRSRDTYEHRPSKGRADFQFSKREGQLLIDPDFDDLFG